MFKKILLLLFSLFFLCSCWDDRDNSIDSSLTLFENDKFSMSIPTNWTVIENREEVLPTPNVWEIELAITSPNSVWGFSNNLLILSDNLSKITNSKDFSMLNNIWAESDYLEYTKLSSQDITFLDWDVSIIYEFEAKYNYETPKFKFLQTAHICNQTQAYFITLALPTTTDDITKYISFISSFSCK